VVGARSDSERLTAACGPWYGSSMPDDPAPSPPAPRFAGPSEPATSLAVPLKHVDFDLSGVGFGGGRTPVAIHDPDEDFFK
jgi:hypothetical protein